ncbi:MAG: phage portal protein [Alphaproteobacteria bacterium]
MKPEDWLEKLTSAQESRRARLEQFDAYYRGDHPLAFATREFLEAFGGLFGAFSDNWCETVVNAVKERLHVTGFRFGEDSDADTEAWDIWQRNALDLESNMAHLEALVFGVSYALVWPLDGLARVTVEHPYQVVTVPKAGDRRTVAAAMKRYRDDDGTEVAWLYLPGEVRRYRSTDPEPNVLALERVRAGHINWALDRDNDEDGPAVVDNPFGDVVPVVPLENRPRLIAAPRSEIENVIPLQDAVNKEWADCMVASEYAADAQRWILGWEPEVDPESNQPVNPPLDRRKRFLTLNQNENDEHPVTIGQFTPGNLDNYVKVIETLVQHIASQTRTPPHYLNPGADRLSGESIEASESGLISKVIERQQTFGEGWERVMRLAFLAEGNEEKAALVSAETLWQPPILRSDAQRVDAALKLTQIGLPKTAVLEFLNYTPSQIARMLADMETEQAMQQVITPQQMDAVAQPGDTTAAPVEQ